MPIARTPTRLETAIKALLPEHAGLGQSHDHRTIVFKTERGKAVVQVTSKDCDGERRLTFDWDEQYLDRCPLCHFCPGGAVGLLHFDWPTRCPRCGAKFIDARYPYSVQSRGHDGETIEQSFPDEERMNAAVAEFERQCLEYQVRTPHWVGGCVAVSPCFKSTWDRIPDAVNPLRRGPARENRRAAADMQSRPQTSSMQCCRNNSRNAA